MSRFIRLFLTGILLYFCWQGKILAIALCLTLNAIAWEFVAWDLKKLSEGGK